MATTDRTVHAPGNGLPAVMSPGNPQIPPETERIQLIPLSAIVPSQSNPRKTYDQAALEGLAESIRAQGVVQAIVVRPGWSKIDGPDQEFEIVAGHRRWMASKLAGKATVPAVVRQLSDREVIEIQVTENEQREDVKPLEQARGYQALIDQYAKEEPKANRTALIERVAKRVGMSVRHIYSRLKLTELAPEVVKALDEGKIEASHADEIARLPLPIQKRALAAAVTTKWIFADGASEQIEAPASIREFKAALADKFQVDLKHAPWDLKDEKLLSRAGSCESCPKRSGNDPSSTDKNQNRCGDTKCFGEKKEAFIAAAEMKAYDLAIKLHPKDAIVNPTPVKIANTYHSHQKLPTTHDWKEAKIGACQFLKAGVIAEGDELGKIIPVCLAKESCVKHWGKVETHALRSHRESAADLEKQTRQKEIEKAGDRAIFAAIMAKVNFTVGKSELELLYDALRELVFDQSPEAMAAICEAMKWPVPTPDELDDGIFADVVAQKIPKMSSGDLGRFLVSSALAMSVFGWLSVRPEKALASSFGVNAEAVRKAAEVAAKAKPAGVQTSARPVKAGVCRVCGCTEKKACVLQTSDSGNARAVVNCKWADKAKTLCTNPACLGRAGAMAGAGAPAPKAAAKPAKKNSSPGAAKPAPAFKGFTAGRAHAKKVLAAKAKRGGRG